MLLRLFSIFCIFPFALSAQTAGDQFFPAWTVHEIRFQFNQPGFWDSLTANYTLDAYMRCSVTVDGNLYTDSGVKYKGNSSYNNPSQKKPFRIDFQEYGSDQTHDGLKKLVLNNAFKDPSFLREKLMLDFIEAHGIVGPRATFARLFVNNEYRGLYTVIEDVGKPFCEDHFGNKGGNLFKGDPHGDLRWKGPDQALYQGDYELKTNETANDWSDLIGLINALNNTPVAQLVDSLSQHLDMDSWFSYWAAHNLFVNLDSYVGSGHNFYLYHNTDTDKFEWITWDVNEAFGNFNMGLSLDQIKNLPFTHIPNPQQNRPIMSRLLPIVSMKQALADKLCVLLQDFTNAKMDGRIDSLANLIRPAVYEDTYKFFSNQLFESNLSQDVVLPGGPGGGNVAGLKPFIATRRSALQQQLAAYGCTVAENTPEAPAAIQVAPNPAGDWVRIATERPINEILIYNAEGQQVFLARYSGETAVELPVEHFAKGYYMLTIETGGLWVKRPLVIL